MERVLQGRYIPIATVGEKVTAFVPAPLPPVPSTMSTVTVSTLTL